MRLSDLRATVAERLSATYDRCLDWTLGDWACAAAGEMGETCNKIKKIRRGDSVPVQDIAEEIADTIIYLDILAAKLNIDLEQAIREKFNRRSDELGFPHIKLPGNRMRSTIKTFSFEDGQEIRDEVFMRLANWFIEHQTSGEGIYQSDSAQIGALEILSDLADDVFKFQDSRDE